MASKFTQEQVKQIYDTLTRDTTTGYTKIESLLKQIISGRDVTLEVPPQGKLSLTAQEAWKVFESWNRDENGGLPLGDRGSIKIRATRLMNYLANNIIGLEQETSAAAASIRKQASQPLPKTATQVVDDNLLKTFRLRNTLREAIEAKFLGKLSSSLEETAFLRKIPDTRTRSMVAAMFASYSSNLRNVDDQMVGRVRNLLLHNSGNGTTNNVLHRFVSQSLGNNTKTEKVLHAEIEQIVNVVNATIASSYASEQEYRQDMNVLRNLQHLSPTLSDIPSLVRLIIPNGDHKEQELLSRALRGVLLSSSSKQHQEAGSIIEEALRQAGFHASPPRDIVEFFTPYLDELQVSLRHKYLGGDPQSHDTRRQTLHSVMDAQGIDADIVWINSHDLETLAQQLDPASHGDINKIRQTLNQELNDLLASGGLETKRISQLKNLLDTLSQHADYQKILKTNPAFATQISLLKTLASVRSTRQPFDEFYHKTLAGIQGIDDIIHWPSRKFADWYFKQQEKSPIFHFLTEPLGFITERFTKIQTDFIVKIGTWAAKQASGDKWYSGIFGHVADFASAYKISNGDIRYARHLFLEKKWGDILNWTARQVGRESWSQLRKEFWTAIANGATTIGNKVAAGLGDRIGTTILGLVTSEAGIGLVILAGQIAWETGKFFFGQIWNFAKSILNGNESNLYGVVPLALGGMFLALNALTLGALGNAILLGKVLWEILKLLVDSLVAIFVLAFIIAGSILVVGLIIFSIFTKLPSQIDPGNGYQLLTNIICEDNMSGTTNKVANCASCLVKYLTQCYGQSVTGTKIKSKGISCLIASIIKPDSAAAIEASATDYKTLQCVGFARAAAVCGGNDLPGKAVASAYIHEATPGYTFKAGAGSCQTGDLGLIDGAIGHIFVVRDNNKATITAIDANFVCPGCVSDNNPIPANKVAGCLKKN